jgi:Fic family protein
MRRITYIYNRPDWPAFRWDDASLAVQLAAVRHRQGRLLGQMEQLGLDVRAETTLNTLTQDALKSSEIEGEALDRDQVRSSLARRLGLASPAAPLARNAEAIATLVIDATQRFRHPLTVERLFGWHRALFEPGEGGRYPITVGGWRTDEFGPMQVVSATGRVHFEAPPAARVPAEMARFLTWFEQPDGAVDPVLKAAIAHIWFVTIHPFDDGNGRIGRAIADMALARAEGTSQRFYSLSDRLRTERSDYYATLEATQKGNLDITPRLRWFLGVLDRALSDAETTLARRLRTSRFWESMAGQPINERQRLMLNRLLDGFVGKLTSSKWAQIAKCSQDTASRDIDALLRQGILAKAPGGGRSTSYVLSHENG